MLATNAANGGGRQRRVGGAHLGGVADSVKRFLQFYFTGAHKSQNSAIFGLIFFEKAGVRKAPLAG